MRKSDQGEFREWNLTKGTDEYDEFMKEVKESITRLEECEKNSEEYIEELGKIIDLGFEAFVSNSRSTKSLTKMFRDITSDHFDGLLEIKRRNKK